jgi:hypothetical protein
MWWSVLTILRQHDDICTGGSEIAFNGGHALAAPIADV